MGIVLIKLFKILKHGVNSLKDQSSIGYSPDIICLVTRLSCCDCSGELMAVPGAAKDQLPVVDSGIPVWQCQILLTFALVNLTRQAGRCSHIKERTQSRRADETGVPCSYRKSRLATGRYDNCHGRRSWRGSGTWILTTTSGASEFDASLFSLRCDYECVSV